MARIKKYIECTCKYCGKTFNNNTVTSPKTACQKHEIYCKAKYDFLHKFGSKDDLEKLLDTYGSIIELHKYLQSINYNIGDGALRKIYKDLKIDTSIKRANNSKIVKEKRKQTNLKLYGAEHNFCKNHPSRLEWEKRLFETEGITNVFQRESVKNKITETLLTKYGVKHIAQRDEFKVTLQYCINKYGKIKGSKEWARICKERGKANHYSYYIDKYGDRALQMWKNRFNHPIGQSCLNNKFEKFLTSNNIIFSREYFIQESGYICRFYDFKIGNILFEINGDYWHANPQKYKKDDLISYPGGERTAKSVWDRDKKKRKLAENHGFKVVYYWECDINNVDRWEQIKKEVLNYAISENKINN